MNKVAFLRKVELFDQLPDDIIQEVAEKCVDFSFQRGYLICEEDKTGDSMFVIAAGLIQVFVDDGHGGEKVLCHLSRGDHFGEMALFTGQPRTASCRALSDISVLGLTRADMEDLITRNPSIGIEIIRTLCLRLARASADTGAAGAHGRVTFVTSPDRSVGRTSLAVNLAAAIEGITKGNVLVFDPQVASKALTAMLGVEGTSEVGNDLLRREAVDLDRCVRQVADGVFVLKPQEDDVALKDVHHHILFSAVRDRFDYVIVDSSLAMASVNRYLMQQADHIVVLLSPENSDPKNYLETFRRLVLDQNDIDADKVTYGVALGEKGAKEFFTRLGQHADKVSFQIPQSTELLERARSRKAIAMHLAADDPYSTAVVDLGRRIAFDRTVELVVTHLPAEGGQRQRVLEQVGSLFESLFSDFDVRRQEGEEGRPEEAKDIYRAWTDRDTLNRVLPKVTEFVAQRKPAEGSSNILLRVNGRSIMV